MCTIFKCDENECIHIMVNIAGKVVACVQRFFGKKYYFLQHIRTCTWKQPFFVSATDTWIAIKCIWCTRTHAYTIDKLNWVCVVDYGFVWCVLWCCLILFTSLSGCPLTHVWLLLIIAFFFRNFLSMTQMQWYSFHYHQFYHLGAIFDKNIINTIWNALCCSSSSLKCAKSFEWIYLQC